MCRSSHRGRADHGVISGESVITSRSVPAFVSSRNLLVHHMFTHRSCKRVEPARRMESTSVSIYRCSTCSAFYGHSTLDPRATFSCPAHEHRGGARATESWQPFAVVTTRCGRRKLHRRRVFGRNVQIDTGARSTVQFRCGQRPLFGLLLLCSTGGATSSQRRNLRSS